MFIRTMVAGLLLAAPAGAGDEALLDAVAKAGKNRTRSSVRSRIPPRT